MKKSKAFTSAPLAFLWVAALSITSGCSTAKEQLGLTRQAPDEFQVVKHDPLTLPPNYNLRPPQPGAPRPQAVTPEQEARESLIERSSQATDSELSAAEQRLLQQAGATQTDTFIRQDLYLNREELNEREKTVSEKLFGWTPSGIDNPNIIDPEAEVDRLQQQQKQRTPEKVAE